MGHTRNELLPFGEETCGSKKILLLAVVLFIRAIPRIIRERGWR